MLNAVCPPSGYAAEQLTVLAGCTQMLDLVHLAGRALCLRMPRLNCALLPTG